MENPINITGIVISFCFCTKFMTVNFSARILKYVCPARSSSSICNVIFGVISYGWTMVVEEEGSNNGQFISRCHSPTSTTPYPLVRAKNDLDSKPTPALSIEILNVYSLLLSTFTFNL